MVEDSNHPTVLQNITRTGVRLGSGSYGEVEELCWNGTMCAGKCLHGALLDQQQHPATSSLVAEKFVAECKMIAQIRHPNVVQFLGLCFFPDDHRSQRWRGWTATCTVSSKTGLISS